MLLSNVCTIFAKEFKETIRDRRTLMFMLLLPTLLMPVMLSLLTSFTAKAAKKASNEKITYAIFGEEQLAPLAEAFAQNPGFQRVDQVEKAQIKQAIAEGTIKMALTIPINAAQQLSTGEQVTVELYFNNATLMSKVAKRAKMVIEEVADKQRNHQLKALGVRGSIAREQLLEPITVRQRGTAEKREVVGATVGGFLPYMFIIFCFLGSVYPAIDLGAGEKERGTLETLLLAPVPRSHMVLGKFSVIFFCGVTSSVLSLASMGAWLFTKRSELEGEISGVINSVGVLDLILVASMLIPVAAIFASLLLTVSIFARSFKEAQAYVNPLNIVIILPAILAMVPGVELDWTWAMVPITNVSLAVKELIKGTMDYQMLVVILGSSTLIAGGMLLFCTKWFERESVLFRE